MCNSGTLHSVYQKFDSLMSSTLSDIVGCAIPQWSLCKGFLLISHEGFGFKKLLISCHAPAAQYASLINSQSLMADFLGFSLDLASMLDSTWFFFVS